MKRTQKLEYMLSMLKSLISIPGTTNYDLSTLPFANQHFYLYCWWPWGFLALSTALESRALKVHIVWISITRSDWDLQEEEGKEKDISYAISEKSIKPYLILKNFKEFYPKK